MTKIDNFNLQENAENVVAPLANESRIKGITGIYFKLNKHQNSNKRSRNPAMTKIDKFVLFAIVLFLLGKYSLSLSLSQACPQPEPQLCTRVPTASESITVSPQQIALKHT